MGKNDWPVGSVFYPADEKDLHTYQEALTDEGYLIKTEGLKITITGMKE